MTPIITKQQIAQFVRLPESIKDADIEPMILDAQDFDTVPILPDAMLRAIEAEIMRKPKQWDKNKTYAVDDVVWYGDERKFYKANSSNTDTIPPADQWDNYELMNFYEQYLRPYLAYCFYYRFIAYHGAHIAPAGIREMREDTSQEISDKRRGEMLGDIKSKKAVWTLKLSKALSDADNTFDGVKYAGDTNDKQKIKPRVQVFQVGGRSKTSKRKWGSQ